MMLSPSLNMVNAATSFEDGFESGNFSQWDGRRYSSGETIGISSYRSILGAYGVRATSNGGGGVEYAYSYKKIIASELDTRATFFVSKSGIVEEGDRIYLITYQTGSNTLASVGWRKIGGVVKWFLLIRSGSSTVVAYSTESPQLNKYYTVKLSWIKDAVNGMGSLTIYGSYNDDKTYSIAGKNTSLYGDTSEVRVGLPTISYCGSAAVYFDCVEASSSYVPELYDLGFSEGVFADNFESGTLGKWSGIRNYNGGTTQVGIGYNSLYGAQFGTGTALSYSGQAYLYKNVFSPAEYSTLNDFIMRVQITSLNIGSNGRFTFFRAMDGNTEILSAGWEKTNGVLRWFSTRRDGANLVTVYSTSTPKMNQWYNVRIPWNIFDYSWTEGMSINSVDGTEYLLYSNENGIAYDHIDRIDVGLVKTTNCRLARLYIDNFVYNTHQWE